MQEDYVGAKRNKKRYSYDTKNLFQCINDRINTYNAESVVYITNRFIWEFRNIPKKLAKELNVISKNIYEKRRNSSFSNKELLDFLFKMNVDTLELIGVDGNYCVASTALDGIKKGFSIICNESCIGINNTKKFVKVKIKLIEKGVHFI